MDVYQILLVLLGVTEVILAIVTIRISILQASMTRRQVISDRSIEEIKTLGMRLNDSRLDVITASIQRLEERMEKGDGAFKNLEMGDHSLEIKQLSAKSEIEVWMNRNAATKQELKEHQSAVDRKFDSIHTDLNNINLSIGRLSGLIEKGTKNAHA